jgi:F-type H+-transporting ATPase subunit b
MGELIQKLGIDWKLLIAQIINFLILLFVLYKFAYKPILNLMHKREKKIEDSLKNADKIQKELVDLEEKKAKEIQEARIKSQAIIDQATKSGDKLKEEFKAEAKKDSEEIVKKAKEEIEIAKNKMVSEAKKEVVGMVVSVSEKIIKKNLDDTANRDLIEETIKEIKK